MMWVYGIRCGEFIKVGISRDITRRMQSMRIGNPHPMKVVFRRRVPDAPRIERRMHSLLVADSIGREWFRVSTSQVSAAFKIALAEALVRMDKQREWEAQNAAKVAARTRGLKQFHASNIA